MAVAALGGQELELCVGCRTMRRCRLGIESVDLQGTSAIYHLECPAEYQGAPDIAPGWWTAACADELLGRLPNMLGTPAVTAQLTVDFTRPVPVAVALLADATVTDQGSRWVVRGSIQRADTGQVVAQMTARCHAVDPMTARDRADA